MPERDDDAAPESTDSIPTPVSVFHDAAVKRLDIQITSNDALDSKAWNALSIGSAILPITFGLLGLSEIDVPWPAWICLGLAGLAFGALLAHAWTITFGAYSMRTGGPITELREHTESGEYPGEGLLLWLAREYESATTANEATIFRKSKYVGRACAALYLEIGFLSLAAVFTLVLR
jgi:hypothetical protein